MLEIFSIILLVCSIYLVSIGLYSYIAKVSIAEARGKIVHYVKEIFGLIPPEQMYDVMIGMDEGVPNAYAIDNEFEKLGEIFSAYYFANYYFRDGVSCYVFTVGPAKKEIDFEYLSIYVQGICDAIVHDFLHKYNPYIGKIQDLVVTEIIDSTLRVYIATTESATNLLVIKKANMRLSDKREVLQNNQVKRGSIEI